jgi:hypothetical protein
MLHNITIMTVTFLLLLQETAIDYHKVKKDVEVTAEKAKQRAKDDTAKVAAAAKEASAKAAVKAKEAGVLHGMLRMFITMCALDILTTSRSNLQQCLR